MLGFKGERGYSAYEIAVQNGFVGSEQSWLAQLGTSNVYGQKATTIMTIVENQKELDLPNDYNSNSMLTIYIDGLKLNDNEYEIDLVNKKAILATPIKNVGTKVEMSMTTMTATNLPITTEVNSLSTDKTSPSSKCVYEIKTDIEKRIEKIDQDIEEMYGNMETIKTKLDNIEEGANKTVIEDSLTSSSKTKALSANQGRILEEEIKGTVLYEDSIGTTGEVTLNDSILNYKYIEIYGNYLGRYCYTKVSAINGIQTALQVIQRSTNSVYLRFSDCILSDTKITRFNYSELLIGDPVYEGNVDIITIYKVIGYK